MILCCKIECLKKKVLFEDKDDSVLHILEVYDICTANTIFVTM